MPAAIYNVIGVSIHAPAWGATSLRSEIDSLSLRFNPRARVGRDGVSRAAEAGGVVSIHAPAWGATRWMRRDRAIHARFNPRARVGRDR